MECCSFPLAFCFKYGCVRKIFKLPPAHPDTKWFTLLGYLVFYELLATVFVDFYLDWFTELGLFALRSIILARQLEYFAKLMPEGQAVSYATIGSWTSG